MQKYLQSFLIFVVSIVLLTGCGGKNQQLTSEESQIPMATQDIFAMDTYMTLTGYGEKAEEAISAAVDEINRINSLFSVGDDASEIAILNSTGMVTASEDTIYVLKEALSLYESTDGIFDISIYPLMVLWGFTSGNYQVPEPDKLKECLNYVDASQITLDEATCTVSIEKGQGIDFGGIAKGYTSDRIMEIFKEYELVSGVISLGGNVQCYSGKIDGSPWNCGIQDPDDTDSIMCVVSVKDKAVITSGGYERYFTDDQNQTWHHILNPATGYSAESGLSSVTIVSNRGILADGLSTSVFIMGLDKAIEYWSAAPDTFDMILVTEDRELYITEGICDAVSSDYPIHIIHL